MSKSVKMQIKTILDKKLAIIIFSVLTVMVVINFFGNLVKYDGQPVDTLIDPMRMLMLSAADYDTASVKFIFFTVLSGSCNTPGGVLIRIGQDKQNGYISYYKV